MVVRIDYNMYDHAVGVGDTVWYWYYHIVDVVMVWCFGISGVD